MLPLYYNIQICCITDTIQWLTDRLKPVFVCSFVCFVLFLNKICMRNKAGGKETMPAEQTEPKESIIHQQIQENVITLLTLYIGVQNYKNSLKRQLLLIATYPYWLFSHLHQIRRSLTPWPLGQPINKNHIILIISLHNRRHKTHDFVFVLDATLKVLYLISQATRRLSDAEGYFAAHHTPLTAKTSSALAHMTQMPSWSLW